MHRAKTLYFETLFRLRRVCLLLFGGLLLFSVMLMLLGGTLIYRSTVDWPQTKGQLLKFDVHPLKGHPAHLKADVGFRYSVDGQNYDGQYLSAMTRPGKIPWWRARHKQNQYRVGRDVSVIYDPDDPSHSYLETPDLFWDVCLVPVSIGGLAVWLLYLFAKTKRRKVPVHIVDRKENQLSNIETWRPTMKSVLERDYVVLEGTATHSAAGGLFAGWPQCHIALIASPNEFAVVPGPYTKRGLASSFLTLVLEFSLSRFWLPALHGSIFLFQARRRRRHWRLIRERRFSELMANSGNIAQVSIDLAVVYGYEPSTRRLWYRLPGQIMDEFIQLPEEKTPCADELTAYVSLMQNANFGD